MGLCSALELQRRGKKVALFDPGSPLDQASFGNAGVISRGSIFPVAGPGLMPRLAWYGLGGSVAVRVNWRSMHKMTRWMWHFLLSCNQAAWVRGAEELDPLVRTAFDHHMALADEFGMHHHYRRTGFLRLYRRAGSLAGAERERKILERFGVEAHSIDATEISELEPALVRRYAEGLQFSQSASVDDPGAIVAKLLSAFIARGGQHIAARVSSLLAREAGVSIVAGGVTYEFAQAVVAAGAYSSSLARQLGDRIPLIGERGYHRLVPWRGEARLSRPVYDVMGGYVATPMTGGVRVLTGVELAPPDAPADMRQMNAVLADAAKNLPIEAEAAGPMWMGSRPSTPDSLPVIGLSRASRSIAYAFGHGHIGFANAPATARAVGALLSGQRPEFPIQAFSPQRF